MSWQGKRIALFAAAYGLSTNPTILALLDALSKDGASVDFYCRGNPGGQLPDQVDLQNVMKYPFPDSLNVDTSGWRSLFKSFAVYCRLSNFRGSRQAARTRYDMVIGVDDLGILAAERVATRQQIPLVFLSFELTFASESLSQASRRMKNHEVSSSRKADLVIVQDEKRAELLVSENGLDRSKVRYLPVAPNSARVRSDSFLRTRFRIPEDSPIVLHSGSFADWTCADELIDQLPRIADSVTVVIHTRWNPNVRGNRFIDRLRQVNLPNVIISDEPLPEHDYERMVDSADVGLVLYQREPAVGKNVGNIGLSSGKFAYYAKHGLPIISLQQSVYGQLFADYPCGVDMSDMKELQSAITTAMANYDEFSRNSRLLFREKLDFDANWNRLKPDLVSLVA